MILNKDLTSELLQENITELLESPDKLKAMSAASLSLGRPQAAEEIAKMILKLTDNSNINNS